MEITYKNRTVRFEDNFTKFHVMLNSKIYRVPWGRRTNEYGALLCMSYVGDHLVRAGLFDGFRQQLVPILADEYKTEDDRGHLVPDVIQPGQYIQGLMINLNEEKCVYVVGLIFKSSNGYYISPKLMWK